MTCLICGVDDGLAIMCGHHWSEFVQWEREQGAAPPAEGDDE